MDGIIILVFRKYIYYGSINSNGGGGLIWIFSSGSILFVLFCKIITGDPPYGSCVISYEMVDGDVNFVLSKSWEDSFLLVIKGREYFRFE